MKRKTMANVMTILTIIIAITAAVVCYLAIERENYLIAGIMAIVVIGQGVNFILWRKKANLK